MLCGGAVVADRRRQKTMGEVILSANASACGNATGCRGLNESIHAGGSAADSSMTLWLLIGLPLVCALVLVGWCLLCVANAFLRLFTWRAGTGLIRVR